MNFLSVELAFRINAPQNAPLAQSAVEDAPQAKPHPLAQQEGGYTKR